MTDLFDKIADDVITDSDYYPLPLSCGVNGEINGWILEVCDEH